MPGKEGLAARLGHKLFDEPAIRELYLSKIREKNGRNEAARLIDVAPSTVWRYCQAHPEFLREVQEAEATKAEVAQRFWFSVMEDEDAPLKDRLKSSELIERAFGRESKRDPQVIEKQTIVISGDQMERVLEMQQRLTLEAGPDTLEATVINESDTQNE